MNPHWLVILESSDALNVDGENAVSVSEYVPVEGPACTVVPQASRPGVSTLGVAALQPALALVATSLITMDVGTAGVSVLLIRSLLADSDFRPFGVTVQVQHEINCSSGLNVYTLVQMLPPLAPVLVRLL